MSSNHNDPPGHDHDHDHDHDDHDHDHDDHDHDDHDHDHDDHDHDHDDHDHDHDHEFAGTLRIGVAAVILLAAVFAACIVMVPAGEAGVITRFGNPARVVTEPGLAWK